jgi:hypothetical protein
MLERGRGLLLGSLGTLRTPLDALRLANEGLAGRIQALAVELDCLQKLGTSDQIIMMELASIGIICSALSEGL